MPRLELFAPQRSRGGNGNVRSNNTSTQVELGVALGVLVLDEMKL